MRISDFSRFSVKKPQFISGYSLIELVVSISVLLVLSGIVLSYGRGITSSLALANQQAALMGIMSRAKSLSQSFSFLDAPAGMAICSYGLQVDRTGGRVFIFRDLVDEGADCDTADNQYTSSNPSERLAGSQNSFVLENQFEFVSANTVMPDLDFVVFVPPEPTVIINNDPTDISDPSVGTKSALLVVQHESVEDRSFTMRITSFGQISLE